MTTNRKPTPRDIWIAARSAELMTKGWRPDLAAKRAARDYKAHSPQRARAERMKRDLARDATAYRLSQ